MSAQDDLGPALPSRVAVYMLAGEIHALARLAVEFAGPGTQSDLPRAIKQIARIRESLGCSEIGGGELAHG